MMMKRLIPVVAVMVLFAGQAMAQKIAIANPAKILNALKETKDINDTVNAKRQALETEAKQREQALKDIEAKRDQLKPDSPQYLELNNKLIGEKTAAQIWANSKQAELANELRNYSRRMFDKISAAIAEVAKAKNLDLVLADQRAEIPEADMDKIQPAQLTQALFGRTVLFAADQLDITQEVIAKIDAAYSGPIPPAAPALVIPPAK